MGNCGSRIGNLCSKDSLSSDDEGSDYYRTSYRPTVRPSTVQSITSNSVYPSERYKVKNLNEINNDMSNYGNYSKFSIPTVINTQKTYKNVGFDIDSIDEIETNSFSNTLSKSIDYSVVE